MSAVRVCLLVALVSACATVRPWERERLSARCMSPDDPASASAFDAHVRAVRSGDTAAGGVGGGGCGCN